MKKNVAIVVMAGLVVYFLYFWQTTAMREESHKKKVAQLAQTIARQMKTGQENFEWREFVEKRDIETLLMKSLEGIESNRLEDIDLEIQKRLLGYGGSSAEPRVILIKKFFESAVGRDYLVHFVKQAKETIRIYEEERGR